MNSIDNTHNLIDSRSVQERLGIIGGLMRSTGATPAQMFELHRLRTLTEDAVEAIGYDHEEWRAGVTLIRYDYFVTWIRDSGTIPNIPKIVVVDWEATARGLLPDYIEIDFDGVTYYVAR